MKKIQTGLYKIDRNVDLISHANSILNKPLPTCFEEKSDAFYETANILSKIIKDRSDRIDDCFRDYLNGKPLGCFAGQKVSVLLDLETE